MKIVVFPHDMNLGGSQLNAIELAGAVRDLGHDVVLFGRPGTLNDRVAELGLEFVASPEPGLRPSRRVVQALRTLVAERGVHVVHGYEWPPILESRLACAGRLDATCVGTVMSMSVAPFIPRQLPLVVGTAQIAHAETAAGRGRVHVIEPPVDVENNRPGLPLDLTKFRAQHGIPDKGLVVVTVSRLARELKLEGLLCAIAVLPSLSDTLTFVIVGDGPARGEVMSAASAANARAGRRAVILTGELPDPRMAYATADIVLGMGGSALRAMAFAKPLVVQGEKGYWSALSEPTLESFLWTGWYGVGADASHGPANLRACLEPLLVDKDLRRSRGAYARREVVQRFSLEAAAQRQLAVYENARAHRASAAVNLRHNIPAGFRLMGHTARRQALYRLGRGATDDFNSRPVAAVGAPGEGRSE